MKKLLIFIFAIIGIIASCFISDTFFLSKEIQHEFDTIDTKYADQNGYMTGKSREKALNEIDEYGEKLKKECKIKYYKKDTNGQGCIIIELWSGITMIYNPKTSGLFLEKIKQGYQLTSLPYFLLLICNNFNEFSDIYIKSL